jgi:hypothetical protein
VAVAACAGLSLILGIVPAPLSDASREAAVAAINNPDPGPPATPETASAAQPRPADDGRR